MSNRFEALAKLLEGPRQLDKSKTAACLALMREFLRREALWAKQLGIEEELPFANLAGAILPDFDYARDYIDLIRTFIWSSIESVCCARMLNWYGIARDHRERLTSYTLSDPYLALLHLFELGGEFTREHRVYVDVNHQGIHAGILHKGRLDEPLAELADW